MCKFYRAALERNDFVNFVIDMSLLGMTKRHGIFQYAKEWHHNYLDIRKLYKVHYFGNEKFFILRVPFYYCPEYNYEYYANFRTGQYSYSLQHKVEHDDVDRGFKRIDMSFGSEIIKFVEVTAKDNCPVTIKFMTNIPEPDTVIARGVGVQRAYCFLQFYCAGAVFKKLIMQIDSKCDEFQILVRYAKMPSNLYEFVRHNNYLYDERLQFFYKYGFFGKTIPFCGQ